MHGNCWSVKTTGAGVSDLRHLFWALRAADPKTQAAALPAFRPAEQGLPSRPPVGSHKMCLGAEAQDEFLSVPGTLSAAGSGRTNLQSGGTGVVAVVAVLTVHPTTKLTERNIRNHAVARQRILYRMLGSAETSGNWAAGRDLQHQLDARGLQRGKDPAIMICFALLHDTAYCMHGMMEGGMDAFLLYECACICLCVCMRAAYVFWTYI